MTDQPSNRDEGPGSAPGENQAGAESVPEEPPPPPNPSSDPGLAAGNTSPARALPNENDDLFRLSPRAALKLLAMGLEDLVRITGDVPPTPPPTSPTIPNMRGMQAEKESIVRSHSEKSLARMRQQAEAAEAAAAVAAGPKPSRESSGLSLPSQTSGSSTPSSTSSKQQIFDGVRLRSATPTSPPPFQPPPGDGRREPYIIIGADAQPLNVQHSAIVRKFYGKQPPRVSIEEYLMRMHRFCPMSTAVYLATSLYIHRLAVEERAIPVARRNVHRLLLGGLRVAMKALEDKSYSHAKMAKVGGVSEPELARLEIHFCFLTNFELAVTEEVLHRHWDQLRDGRALGPLDAANQVPVLRLDPQILKGINYKENQQLENTI